MRELETTARDRLKSRFVFTVARGSGGWPTARRFRDPVGMQICDRLVGRLRADGFTVTKPTPGNACDAGFGVKFSDFTVSVVLLVGRRVDSTECALLTWCSKSLWRRVSVDSAYANWAELCTGIERGLRDDPSVTSLLSLTWNEAEARLRSR